MKAATFTVRRPSGAAMPFVADDAEIRDGMLIASGKWKGSIKPPAEYAWPTSRVLEIRWEAGA